jgi:molybdopterin-guanine dinucleotide biosynthesis protein B
VTIRRLADYPVPVVGFVGPSGIGKTSLLARLVAELGRRGVAVAAVKHASHGFLADRPGKDSYRLYEAGAEAVALISRDQVATFTRAAGRGAKDVSLAAALEGLPQRLDVVLAEGFSWEPVPRVVLFRSGEEPAPEHVERGEVLARVCAPRAPEGEPPTFSEELVESLIRLIEARIGVAHEASDVADAERPEAESDRNSA